MYIRELEDRENERSRNRENSARLAFAQGTFESTGQGTVEFENMIDFGLTFIDRPYVSTGAWADFDQLRDLVGVDDDGDVMAPHVTGFVTDWQVDSRGFYTGAWVAARVTWNAEDLVDITLQPKVIHDFTFQGIAIKDVPLDDLRGL